MLACVLAYYTSARIEPRSIYSDSLKRKGGGRFSAQLVDVNVSDLMKPSPVTVHTNAGFAEIGQKFLSNRINYLYVIDSEGRFLGAISLHDIKNFLQDPSIADLVIAHDLTRERFPSITLETPLSEALIIFGQHDGERLPVLQSAHDRRVVGSLSKTDLILALAAASQNPMSGKKPERALHSTAVS